MVALKSHGKTVFDIKEESIEKILNIYPGENLFKRPVFVDALSNGELTYSDLRQECNKLLIPWQLFLLEPDKLDSQIKDIVSRRSAKFDKKLIANRDGSGKGVSLRIADRLIALQEFACEQTSTTNDYCGLLKNIHCDKWADKVIEYFDINTELLANGQKQKTLEYLITQFEGKNLRIARGVLTNKLLPQAKDIQATFRKSSGFVVKDDKVPYVFLPNEISDLETPGRQILTLITLVILVGLDKYNLYITGDLELVSSSNRTLRQIFGVASEILLPYEVSEKLLETEVTEAVRDELSSKYMLTPSALIVTLKQRGCIENDDEYDKLLNNIEPRKDKAHKRTPNIDTAVKKFCGKATNDDIIHGLKTGSLQGVKAQYLMFGRVDKKKFETYKANLGI